MDVKDIMSTDVVTLGIGHSVRHAAAMMIEYGISGLAVVDDSDKLVGILTEGDLMTRAEIGNGDFVSAAPDRNGAVPPPQRLFVKGNSWKVGDVMTSNLVTINEGATVLEAAKILLDHQIRRMPVMRGDELVGIVSRRDILKCLCDAPHEGTLKGDDAVKLGVEARLREQSSLLGVIPSVTVKDGVVYLQGQVRTQDERAVLRVIVESVHGAAGLIDETELVSTGASSA